MYFVPCEEWNPLKIYSCEGKALSFLKGIVRAKAQFIAERQTDYKNILLIMTGFEISRRGLFRKPLAKNGVTDLRQENSKIIQHVSYSTRCGKILLVI